MSDATPPPSSERTRPMSGAAEPAPRDGTQTLPGKRPDLPAVALLGSVAYAGSRFRQRLSGMWGRGWGRVVVAAILGVLVVLLGMSLVSSGPEVATVPDVRGRSYQQAAASLQEAGFTPGRVSFAPAEDDQAGRVIETIPAPGTKVEGGSTVHLIAGALTRTPEPSPVVTEQQTSGTPKDEPKKKGRRGRED